MNKTGTFGVCHLPDQGEELVQSSQSQMLQLAQSQSTSTHTLHHKHIANTNAQT